MATQSLSYADTADTVALTITLASLATDANLLTGRESTVVDNTSNLYLDAMLTGLITTGTSPTAGVIEIWGYLPSRIVTSTATYHDVLDGTDSAETIGSDEEKYKLPLLASIATNANSDEPYPVLITSLAKAFGGYFLPTHWGVFITHNTAVNLNATAGNHYLHYQGIKLSSA